MTHRFLQELKSEILDKEWTPERSNIVSLIDHIEEVIEDASSEKDRRQMDKGITE